MAENLVLSEPEFDEFKRYCQGKGFDLSYISYEISGSKEEIEHYQSDSPKVIKLRKRRFGFKGVAYDVAEWQRKKWDSHFSRIKQEFSKKRSKIPI